MGSGFLGSGPGRRRSPVEWGKIPSICSFVRTPMILRALKAWRALWEAGEPSGRPREHSERPGEPSGWLGSLGVLLKAWRALWKAWSSLWEVWRVLWVAL